jgi:hypothetical protein
MAGAFADCPVSVTTDIVASMTTINVRARLPVTGRE